MPEQLWLTALKQHIVDTTTAAAAEIWRPVREGQPPYYNYRLEHIEQVERDALAIAAAEGGDRDILLAAVWAHDRFQPQFEGENHAERAAEWAKDYLKFIHFPENKIPIVYKAILFHNRKPLDIPGGNRDARILWDADHVARAGPQDIVSYLLCHSSGDFLMGLPSNASFPTGAVTVRDFTPLLLESAPAVPPRGMVLFRYHAPHGPREDLRVARLPELPGGADGARRAGERAVIPVISQFSYQALKPGRQAPCRSCSSRG